MVASRKENRPSTSAGNASDTRAITDENLELRQRLADYRSLMLANVTHDLRTPLTAILGFAEIMLAFEKLTEQQTQLCQRIQNSGRQLQSTINLLSDVIRLDFNESEVTWHEFSPGNAVRESCAAVSRKAEKKNVVLARPAAYDSGSVVSDEGRLRQTLYNFIAYAVARSPEGGRVTLTTKTTPAGEYLVTIDDEGDPVEVQPGPHLTSLRPSGENPELEEASLDISLRLLNTLGGILRLEQREPQGLSIEIKLPQRPLEK